jgi:hypothetical protein
MFAFRKIRVGVYGRDGGGKDSHLHRFHFAAMCQKIVTSADNNGEVGGKMCLRQFRTLLYLTLHRLSSIPPQNN